MQPSSPAETQYNPNSGLRRSSTGGLLHVARMPCNERNAFDPPLNDRARSTSVNTRPRTKLTSLHHASQSAH
eukprot:11181974-Lingulodinium_polyedra.AAC.1